MTLFLKTVVNMSSGRQKKSSKHLLTFSLTFIYQHQFINILAYSASQQWIKGFPLQSPRQQSSISIIYWHHPCAFGLSVDTPVMSVATKLHFSIWSVNVSTTLSASFQRPCQHLCTPFPYNIHHTMTLISQWHYPWGPTSTASLSGSRVFVETHGIVSELRQRLPSCGLRTTEWQDAFNKYLSELLATCALHHVGL